MHTKASRRQAGNAPASRIHPVDGARGGRWTGIRGPRLGLVATAGLLCLALLASACSSSSGASGSGSPQTITLYNGQHEQTTNALVAAFEKKTGIHVKIRSDDEDVLANQIITEGSGSPADVIYTENS